MDYQLFRSRTFWLIVANFIVVGGNAIVPMVSPTTQIVLNAILAGLAMYTHVNPSQTYNSPN